MNSEKTESTSGSAGGSWLMVGFGTLFMTVGALICWGMTRDFEHRWAAGLHEDGYGTPAQIQEAEQAKAAFAPALADWRTRDAQRLEAVKGKLTPESEEGALEKELEALRDAAQDWEPQPPADPPRPMPEGIWAQLRELPIGSRGSLFLGPIVAPVFIIPGLFIALGGLASLFGGRGGRALARRFPDRPWLHDSDWSALRGSSSATGNLAGIMMMFALFGWVDFWVTLSWVTTTDPTGNATFITAMVNFLTAIIGLLAARRMIQSFKFGRTRLLLAQVPLEPGKNFATRLLVPGDLAAAEKLEATLQLQKVTTVGRGKNQRTVQVTLFSRDLVVPRAAFIEQGGQLAVELRFDVPDDQPTSHSGSEPGYLWSVEVSAETPGIDFEESFEVPVYRVGIDDQPVLRTDWQR